MYIDLLLLILGIILVLRQSYGAALAIIVILASNFLQVPQLAELCASDLGIMTIDMGLILYILFFFSIIAIRGLGNSKSKTCVIVFCLFLLANGIFDYFQGTYIGDIIRYLRHWIYLLTVFIAGKIRKEEIVTSIKILMWITSFVCILILIQRTTGIIIFDSSITQVLDNGTVYERGIKPPSFTMLFSIIAITNPLGLTLRKRSFLCATYLLPIVLSLKMTYFITVLLGCLVYHIFTVGFSFKGTFSKVLLTFTIFSLILMMFPALNERILGTVSETETFSLDDDEASGNFSYRLLHFEERWNYVTSSSSTTFIRGIGYVQEKNYDKSTFIFGQINRLGERSQLDTGDIAWSILILRLGVLGIVIFLIMYRRVIIDIHRTRQPLNTVFVSYMLVYLFFSSLGNALISDADFYIYPLLLTI